MKSYKYTGWILYFVLLAIVGGKLFFESQFDTAWRVLSGILTVSAEKSITIAYSESANSLNPLANDLASRARLLHIYEPLIIRNADLGLSPGLAVSYGSLDDLTWEFKIRQNVLFHDGSPLTLDDVVESLNKGMESENSGVKDLGSTIQSIEKKDDNVVQIKTKLPDPLLPQKISFFLIFPMRETKDLVGTGPYEVSGQSANELRLTRFEKYWGTLPVVVNVRLKTISDRDEKVDSLRNESVQILANVPQDSAKNFDFKNFALQKVPSLEVNFLIFNFDKVFKPSGLRKAIRMTLDPKELAGLTQGFAAPMNQFVAKGIFGYNPAISFSVMDSKKAEQLVKNTVGFFRVQANLDLPKGLESLGLNVKEKLRTIGIDINLVFLSPSELEAKIRTKQSDFFFFGWASDLGDASDFLSAVVHSPTGNFGQFNGANYRNLEVDQIIEFGQNTVDPSKRLEKLRAAMKKITEDDVIGIPLFSPETLYAVSTGIKWNPRVDGHVLAQEIKF